VWRDGFAHRGIRLVEAAEFHECGAEPEIVPDLLVDVTGRARQPDGLAVDRDGASVRPVCAQGPGKRRERRGEVVVRGRTKRAEQRRRALAFDERWTGLCPFEEPVRPPYACACLEQRIPPIAGDCETSLDVRAPIDPGDADGDVVEDLELAEDVPYRGEIVTRDLPDRSGFGRTPFAVVDRTDPASCPSRLASIAGRERRVQGSGERLGRLVGPAACGKRLPEHAFRSGALP
jgi:hypothetical protein